MSAEQIAFPMPVAGLNPVSLGWANTLLARWGHYLGPCQRPGGGAWSRKRYATDAVHGRKTLWLWRYAMADGGEVA